MKNEYFAYVREIDGQLFYFVKNFLVIPELKKEDAVLIGFGMHLQFDKACAIAGITDGEERQKIYASITPEETVSRAKVIDITNFKKSEDKKIS